MSRRSHHPPPDPEAPLSVAFVSLGCPKNLVDSEKMLGLLAEDGIAITADHDQADAIVINTCGFLEAAKVESLEVIREAVSRKESAEADGRAKRIVVAGCLVQRHKAQLLDEVPQVDALVGVFDRENIVSAVRGGGFAGVPDDTSDLGQYHAVTTFIHKPGKADIGKGYRASDRARLRLTPRHYAYLRISEGCNQGCTFCTIPSIRGRMRSKPLANILAEARELFADGAVELNLIGQDTTSYGQDIGYSAPGEGLCGLLRALDALAARRAPGAWLRLMYAYPSSFSDEMITALAECRHLVKYIDMPLQHINDVLLRTMRRKVTRREIECLLEKLRRRVPGIALRTTFISGFPTESDAQHRELLRFIEEFQFDNLGVFEFSPEGGTPAGRLHQSAGVAGEVAAARKEELMLAQQQVVLRRNAGLVGETMRVLIDQANPRRRTAAGRHAGQAPEIDGQVLVNGCRGVPGEMVSVRVESFDGYDLVARPTAAPVATGPAKNRAAKAGRKATVRIGLPVVEVITGAQTGEPSG